MKNKYMLDKIFPHKKSGLSLMEMLIALPMLAFVFLGAGYLVATTSSFSSVDIAKIKTQVAVNNILLIIKAEGYSKFSDIINQKTVATKEDSEEILRDENGRAILLDLEDVEIPKNSIIHPDGWTNLRLTIKRDTPEDNSNLYYENKEFFIKVVAPGFENIQTNLKTLLF